MRTPDRLCIRYRHVLLEKGFKIKHAGPLVADIGSAEVGAEAGGETVAYAACIWAHEHISKDGVGESVGAVLWFYRAVWAGLPVEAGVVFEVFVDDFLTGGEPMLEEEFAQCHGS